MLNSIVSLFPILATTNDVTGHMLGRIRFQYVKISFWSNLNDDIPTRFQLTRWIWDPDFSSKSWKWDLDPVVGMMFPSRQTLCVGACLFLLLPPSKRNRGRPIPIPQSQGRNSHIVINTQTQSPKLSHNQLREAADLFEEGGREEEENWKFYDLRHASQWHHEIPKSHLSEMVSTEDRTETPSHDNEPS